MFPPATPLAGDIHEREKHARVEVRCATMLRFHGTMLHLRVSPDISAQGACPNESHSKCIISVDVFLGLNDPQPVEGFVNTHDTDSRNLPL